MVNNLSVIGHRGASAFLPDNTIESFQQALTDGADLIELDVRKTADDQLVLYHDWYAKSEFGGSKPVAMVTYSELSSFGRRNGFDLTLFEDVLRNFAGKLGLNIELKAGGYEREALDMVYKYDMAREVVFSSFFPWVILKLKSLDGAIKTGWIVGQEQVLFFNRFGGPLVEMLFGLMRAESIHLHYKIITAKLVQNFHSEGIPVYAWTVDDVELMKELIKIDIDGIITNRPGQLRALLNGNLDEYVQNQAHGRGVNAVRSQS
jgi:glycerophosphoryl diester phosphodiesterase